MFKALNYKLLLVKLKLQFKCVDVENGDTGIK